ncbi:MAG: hypothetical protein U0237_09945 [Thermoleophilia bacterium]
MWFGVAAVLALLTMVFSVPMLRTTEPGSTGRRVAVSLTAVAAGAILLIAALLAGWILFDGAR